MELVPRGVLVPVVQVDPKALSKKSLAETLGGLEDPLAAFVLVDGDDDHLDGGEAGREDEAPIVPVGHDDGPDEAPGEAPARGVDVLHLEVPVLELDVKGAGEVLPQVVAGARLEGLAVFHQGLNGGGVDGPGELLLLGLQALNHGDGGVLPGEAGVDGEHPPHLLLRLLPGGVGGVPLLPQKLARAKERPRAHLPAHHVAPLVQELGQVAPAPDPLGPHVADDRLRGGADRQGLLQLLAPRVGDHGELGENPSTCSASFLRKLMGMKRGK